MDCSVQASKFPTFDEYRASVHQQVFPFPDSVVYYITKNPSTAKVYQKLIQTCKYFFNKNSILVLHCLRFEGIEWKTCSNDSKCIRKNDNNKSFQFDKILSKIWVTEYLKIFSNRTSLASEVIKKFYKCDATHIGFDGQTIPFKEFLFYCKKVRSCVFQNHRILFQNGSEVPSEIIFENLQHLSQLKYKFNSDEDLAETQKKLFQIPHFRKLKVIELDNLSESFDIDNFYDFIRKQNRKIKTALYFKGQLSNAYKTKLEKIINEILSKNSSTYFPMYISYPHMVFLKRIKLFNWYKSFKFTV